MAPENAAEQESGLSQPVEVLIEKNEVWQPAAKADVRPKSVKPVDILIIGSGYGGAVAAARFAGASGADGQPLRVVLLERGREIAPGSFPDNWAQLPGEVRIQRHDNDELIGNADALFDIRLGKTVNVMLGNGLGGGSLINAAVAEAPEQSVWQNPRWPEPLRQSGAMQIWFARAKKCLGARRINDWAQTSGGKSRPAKLATMQELDRAINSGKMTRKSRYQTVNIAIDGDVCVQCGDCMTGCNLNAKNTLPKTYLASAHDHGAEMYTGATASHLERDTGPESDGGWLLHFVLTGSKGHAGLQQKWVIAARHVILAAGALGSTEILQRSQHVNTAAALPAQAALRFSARLGMQFSCNGDMIWSGYAQNKVVGAIADPAAPLNARKVGPTICSMIDLRDQATPHVIQDASVPGPMKRLFEEMITTAAVSYRMMARDTEVRRPGQDSDALDPDKLARSAVYLSMGCDSSNGELGFLADTPHANTGLHGRSRVRWGEEREGQLPAGAVNDNVSTGAVYLAAEASLNAVSRLGGTLIPNPMWRAGPTALLDQLSGPKQLKSTMTVHPLGGCGMADDICGGVVNHFGAVFDLLGHGLDAVHPGLYVLDGAVIPVSIGINPLLTITALAERAVEEIASHEGWRLQRQTVLPQPATGSAQALLPAHTPLPPERSPFTFQEKMDCDLTADSPRPAGTPLADAGQMELEVNFEIGKDNLAGFLQNPQRSVVIENAVLRFNNALPLPRNGVPCKLAGKVGWLLETPQTANAKQQDGFYHYLVSRAEADIVNMPDIPAWIKWLLRKAIGLIRRWRIKLPVWLTRLLGKWDVRIKNILALATHTGGQRLLTYELQSTDGEGWSLRGQKVINYSNGSNLWRSISDMQITLARHGKVLGDYPFVLNWHKIFEGDVMQLAAPAAGPARNPDLWMDLASVAALWLRSVMRIHFWSFRLPEAQQAKRERILPRTADSTWHPLTLQDWHGREVALGVTHFPAPKPNPALPPLLLIHGFGASGLQFAAPDMPQTMVQHLQDAGRDVWVAELRTSIVMNTGLPDKHAQWSLDEVAMEDIPALIRLVIKETNALDPDAAISQVDILAHCIGSAMFNIAVLSGRLQADGAAVPASLVRRAALLQVGPVFTVSKGNKLRAYMTYFLGGGLQRDFVDSSTDAVSQDWKDALLDRFLNSYPVPQHEIRADNPARSILPVFPGNQWLANYFRSTGVFGRLFNIDQLSVAMLNNLGTLLGRTNFKTFRQILQSIMQNHLVDAEGRNVYVNADQMRRYYTFPVQFFHGANNDVFARDGVLNSVRQLRAAHGWPATEAERDQSPFAWKNLENFGHLDPLIGMRAPADVFPLLSGWLNQPCTFSQAGGAEPWSLRYPDYGPLLGWTRLEQGQWLSRVWLHARESEGIPVFVAVFCIRDGMIDGTTVRLFPLHACPLFKIGVIDLPLPEDDAEYGFVMLHRGNEAGTGKPIAVLDWNPAGLPSERAPLPPAPLLAQGAIRTHEPQAAVPGVGDYAGTTQTAAEQQLAQQMARLDASKLRTIKPLPAARTVAGQPLRIALGSCRYSGTMIEQVRNNAPYEQLLGALKEGSFTPAFMLLMGDQIYLDATAGVADSAELHAGISLYHRSLARDAGGKDLAVARVFARLPAYMMLDDHEISDNWSAADDNTSKAQDRTRMALAAFLAFQWSHGPGNQALPAAGGSKRAPDYWYTFNHADVELFVLDTRTGRTPPLPARGAHIINRTQLDALAKWLKATRKGGKLRLIVSPSQIADPAELHQLRSDSWAAYPADLSALAKLLLDEDSMAILCGDLHAHGWFNLECHRGSGKPVKRIPVIVASPLYAPYPFANQGSKIRKNRKRIALAAVDSMNLILSLDALNNEYQGFVQLALEQRAGQWFGALYQADGHTPLLRLPGNDLNFPL